MTGRGRIDVPRLLRIATFLFAVAAATGVHLTYQPRIDVLQQRIDDNNNELRSDDIAFAEATTLRGQRTQLANRYASIFAQNAQAVFVRELATTVHRNGVTLIATTVSQEGGNDAHVPGTLFAKTHVSMSLRGSYRRLLAAIADLSMGSEIVEVQPPNLARDGASVIATVPINIYEPLRSRVTSPDLRPGEPR